MSKKKQAEVSILLILTVSINLAANPLLGFKEAQDSNWKCYGDGENCVQAIAESREPCSVHTECKVSCRSGQELAGCFLLSESDARAPVDLQAGKVTLPNQGTCLNKPYTVQDFCGCLPQTKRCGKMNQRYLQAENSWTKYRLGRSCRKDTDCREDCKFASQKVGLGGLACGCTKGGGICSFGNTEDLMKKEGHSLLDYIVKSLHF